VRAPALEPDVLRVFVDDDGAFGNLLGVFLDGAAVPPERRQAVAAELGYSETVFVDDPSRGELRIFTPAAELPLAGHPLVGTAWLLRERGCPVDALRPPAGEVPTWEASGITWIRARPGDAPDFELRRLPSPRAVTEHPGAGNDELLEVWAWEDEPAGRIRARVFPTALGITEDEATGAAALRLGASLDRSLTIRQGGGSVLHVRPSGDGRIDVGGKCNVSPAGETN
jgi:predicted PhzF superfamily epimerase YddE/YHI9